MLKGAAATKVADAGHEIQDTMSMSNRIDPTELNINRGRLAYLLHENILTEQAQNTESTIEELVIYDKSSPATIGQRTYNTRRAKFTLSSAVPLPPPSNKYQTILMNAETLKKLTDYNRKLEKDLLHINVTFYKNYLTRRRQEQAIAKFQARATNLLFLAGGYACFYGSVYMKGASVIKYLVSNNLLTKGGWASTLFRGSLELFFNLQPAQMRVFDAALAELISATDKAKEQINGPPVDLYNMAFNGVDIFSEKVLDTDLGKGMKNELYTGGSAENNMAIGHYQKSVIGFFNTLTDLVSPNGLISHCLKTMGKDFKIKPKDTRKVEPSLVDRLFKLDTREIKLQLLMITLNMDRDDAELLLTRVETFMNTYEGLKWASEVYRDYQMEISNVKALIYDDTYADTGFRLKHVNKFMSRFQQNSTFRNAFKNSFTIFDKETRFFGVAADPSDKTYKGQILLFYDSFSPHNFMGFMTGLVYDEITRTVTTGVQTLSSRIFAPDVAAADPDGDDPNSDGAKKAREMAAYKEMIQTTTLLRLQAGASMEATLVEINKLKIVAHPDYVFDGKDVTVLENIWYYFTTKTAKLNKEGKFTNAIYWTGAATCGLMLGNIFTYDSGNMFNNDPTSWANVVSFFGEPWYELLQNILSSSGISNWRDILQNYRDGLGTLYEQTYDAYIRKPLLAMSFLKQWRKWQGEAKAWAAFSKRWYFSVYINYVLGGLIDKFFNIVTMAFTEGPAQQIMSLDWYLGGDVALSAQVFPRLITNAHISWLMAQLPQISVRSIWGGMAKTFHKINDPASIWDLSNGINIVGGIVQSTGKNIYEDVHVSYESAAQGFEEALPTHSAMFNKWLDDAIESALNIPDKAVEPDTPPLKQDGSWSRWLEIAAKENLEAARKQVGRITGLPGYIAEQTKKELRRRLLHSVAEAQQRLFFNMVPHGTRTTQRTFWIKLDKGGYIALDASDTQAYKKKVDRVEFISFVAQHWLQNGVPRNIDPYTYLMELAPGISRDVTKENAAGILAAAREKYATYFAEAARSSSRAALTDFIGADIAAEVAVEARAYKDKYRGRLGGKTATQLYDLFFKFKGDSYISIGDSPKLYYKIRAATAADTNDKHKLPDGRYMEQITEIPPGAGYMSYAHTTEFFDSYNTGLYGDAYIKSTDTPPDHYLIAGYNTNYIFGDTKSYFYKSLAKASDVYYQRFVISSIHNLYAQNPDAADDDDDDEKDPAKKRAKSIFEERVLAAARKNPRLAEDLHTILAYGNTIAALLSKINRALDKLTDSTRARAQIEKYMSSGGKEGSLIDEVHEDVVALESQTRTRSGLIDQVMNRFRGTEVVKHERARNLKSVKDRLEAQRTRVSDALALLPPDDNDDDDKDEDGKSKIPKGAVGVLSSMVDDLTFSDINKGKFFDIVDILERGDIPFSELHVVREGLNQLLRDIDANQDELDMYIQDIYSTGIPYGQIDGIENNARLLTGAVERLTKAHGEWISGRDKYGDDNAEITSWWVSEIQRRIESIWTQDEKTIDDKLSAAEKIYNSIEHKTPAVIAEYERLTAELRNLKRSKPNIQDEYGVDKDDPAALRLQYTENEEARRNVAAAVYALDRFLPALSGALGRRAFVDFLSGQMTPARTDIVQLASLDPLGPGFIKARPTEAQTFLDSITTFNDSIKTHNTAVTNTGALLRPLYDQNGDISEAQFLVLWNAYKGIDRNLGVKVSEFTTGREKWEARVIKEDRARIISSAKADLLRVETTYKGQYESLDSEIGDLDLVIQQAHLLVGTPEAGYIQSLTLTRDILVSIREKYKLLTTSMRQNLYAIENGDDKLILTVMGNPPVYSGLETALNNIIAVRSNYGEQETDTTCVRLISALRNFYNDPAMAEHKNKLLGTLLKDVAEHGLGIWDHLADTYLPVEHIDPPSPIHLALQEYRHKFTGNLSGRRGELKNSVKILYNHWAFAASKDNLLLTIEQDLDKHGANIWDHLIGLFPGTTPDAITQRNAIRHSRRVWFEKEETLPLFYGNKVPVSISDDATFRVVYRAIETILAAQQALATSHLEELTIMGLHAISPPKETGAAASVSADSDDGDKKPSPMDNLKNLRAFFAKPENNVPGANVAIADIDRIIKHTFDVPTITLSGDRYGNVRTMIQTILNIQILRNGAVDHPFNKNPANLSLLSTMNTNLDYLSKLKKEIEARGTEYAAQSVLLAGATERMSKMYVKWVSAPGYGDPNFLIGMQGRRNTLEGQLNMVIAGTRRATGPYVSAFDIKSAIADFDRDLTDFDTELDEEIAIRGIVADLNKYASRAEGRASKAEESANDIGKFKDVPDLSISVAAQLRTATARIGSRIDPRITAAYDRINAAYLRVLSVEAHIARSRAIDARRQANYWAGLTKTGAADLPGLKTSLAAAEAAMVSAYDALTAGRDRIRDLQNPNALVVSLEELRAAEEEFTNRLSPSWTKARDIYNNLLSRIRDIEHPVTGHKKDLSWAAAADTAEGLANEAAAALAAARLAARAGALTGANSNKTDIEARWAALRDRIDAAQRAVDEGIASAGERGLVLLPGLGAGAHAAAARAAAKKARKAFSKTHGQISGPKPEPQVWDDGGYWYDNYGTSPAEEEGEDEDLDYSNWELEYQELMGQIDTHGISVLGEKLTVADNEVYRLTSEIAARELILDTNGDIRRNYASLNFRRGEARAAADAAKLVADAAEAKYQEMSILLADDTKGWWLWNSLSTRWIAANQRLKWYKDERDRTKGLYYTADQARADLDKETPIDIAYNKLKDDPELIRLNAELVAAQAKAAAAKAAYEAAQALARSFIGNNNNIFKRQPWETDEEYDERQDEEGKHVKPPQTLTTVERARLELFITNVNNGNGWGKKGGIQGRLGKITPAVRRLLGKNKDADISIADVEAAAQKLGETLGLGTALTDAQIQAVAHIQLLAEYLRLHAALAAAQALATRLAQKLSVITKLDEELGERIYDGMPPEDVEVSPWRDVFTSANSRITPFLQGRLKPPKIGLPSNWKENNGVLETYSRGGYVSHKMGLVGWIHTDGTLRPVSAGPPTCTEAGYNSAYDGICKVIPQKDPYDFSDFDDPKWWGSANIGKDTFQHRFFSELTMSSIFNNFADDGIIPNGPIRKNYKEALYECGKNPATCNTFANDPRWSPTGATPDAIAANAAKHQKISDLYRAALTKYDNGKGTEMTPENVLARYIANAVFGNYPTLPVNAVGRSDAMGQAISVGIVERLETFFGQNMGRKKITMQDVFYHDGWVALGTATQGIGVGVSYVGTGITSILAFITGGTSLAADAAIILAGEAAAYHIGQIQTSLADLRHAHRNKLPFFVHAKDLAPESMDGMLEDGYHITSDNPKYESEFRRIEFIHQSDILFLQGLIGVGRLTAIGRSAILAGGIIVGQGELIKGYGLEPIMIAHNTDAAGATELVNSMRANFFSWWGNTHVQDVATGMGQNKEGGRQHALFKGVQDELQNLFTKNKERIKKGPPFLAKYAVAAVECVNPTEPPAFFWDDCRFKLNPAELTLMIDVLLQEEDLKKPEPKIGGASAVSEDDKWAEIERANKQLLFYVFISKIHYFGYDIDHEIIHNMIWFEFQIRLRTLMCIKDIANILGAEPNLVYTFPITMKRLQPADHEYEPIIYIYFDKDSFGTAGADMAALYKRRLMIGSTIGIKAGSEAGAGSEAEAGANTPVGNDESAQGDASPSAVSLSIGGKRKRARKTRAKRLVLRGTLKR